MPPLFHWWFVQKFNTDAHAWYEARLRFMLSAAAWSMVGHVIGLGDRHSENILIETTTGRVVHVDFDWYVLLYVVPIACGVVVWFIKLSV
jgi:serine/threonine-protein kinase ATR